MSELKITWSPRENVLRSVGAMPNGTVGMASPSGEPTFTVDRHYQPDQGQRLELNEEGINLEHSTPIDTETAVAACAGDDELKALVGLALRGATTATGYALGRFGFAEARAWIDQAEATARAVAERIDSEGRGGLTP